MHDHSKQNDIEYALPEAQQVVFPREIQQIIESPTHASDSAEP